MQIQLTPKTGAADLRVMLSGKVGKKFIGNKD